MLTQAEVASILDEVEYLDWTFHLDVTSDEPWLQVRFDAVDLVTGAPERQHARKWKLSYHMTRSEVVQTAFKAILAAVEHEAREAFRYRGRMIYGPHFDVDALCEIAVRGNLDLRTGEWVAA